MKKSLNVLIVDDDDAIRYLTKYSLIKHISTIPLNIYEAINGEEAINLISTSLIPDLILLDINMPLMDGHEFLEAFAQLPEAAISEPHIYVLSTVTQTLPINAQKLVKGHFEKPLNDDHIEQMLTAL